MWIYPALEPSFKRSPAAATQVRPAGEIPRLAAMPRWKLVGIAKRVVVNDFGFFKGKQCLIVAARRQQAVDGIYGRDGIYDFHHSHASHHSHAIRCDLS